MTSPLPDGFLWAAPAAFPNDWCVLRSGTRRMLCGRTLNGGKRHGGMVPLIQPHAVPDGAHPPCVEAVLSRHGVCPVCGGVVAADGGVLVGHGVWRVGRDGMAASDEPCPGAGQAPEDGS